MSSSEKEEISEAVETQVLHVMKNEEYSLGTLNNYGDNLLHLSAANDCHNIIKEILKTNRTAEINRKNYCGWTPLMQAIRNGNIEAVKLLLANGYTPEEDMFKDISPIGLAAAMGLKMFEIVYSACPAALEHAKYNYISPLCAAVMREDKQLLFRLLELGVNVSEASEYTLMLMRQSSIPEIVKLANAHSVKEDYYWTEHWDTIDCLEYFQDNLRHPQMSSTLDNIEETPEYNQENLTDTQNSSVIPKICVIPPSDKKINIRRNSEPLKLNIPTGNDETNSLISPRLTYTREKIFPASPNPISFKTDEENSKTEDFSVDENVAQDLHNDFNDSSNGQIMLNSTFNDEAKMHKYKINRPPNLKILKDVDEEYLLENQKSNQAVLSSKTPIEPRCETPAAAMILDNEQKKMANLLREFGLTRFLFTFLNEEVDLDLFFTLNDQDLQEIGIENKSDRDYLLCIINECNSCNFKDLFN